MKRVLFIYNRHAGKNKTWSELSAILNAMTEQGCLVTAYPTQYPGDAGEAVVRWAGAYDQIVVAGGDGTLSEAISGAIRLPEQPVIGYIPVGTTNDFSKNLDLPQGSLEELAVAAVTGTPHAHDLGRFNGKSFLYVAAFGVFTEISYSTSQKAKNLLGYNAYMLEAMKNFSLFRPSVHIRVEYEDKVVEGDYLYGMVSNTTSVGRFQNFPPGHPDLSDGLLEVTLIAPIRDVKNMEEATRALLLTDPSLLASMTTSFSAPKVKITADQEIAWTLDGEAGGSHRTVEIETLYRAYTILHGRGSIDKSGK